MGVGSPLGVTALRARPLHQSLDWGVAAAAICFQTFVQQQPRGLCMSPGLACVLASSPFVSTTLP